MTMITFTLNGEQVTVPKGTTVYTAAKNQGIKIPIFCYQDRMPPFGACRVCLVEVDKMGKLQTSCTLEATEGMVVKTESALAAEGRESILEFLLINHPLDCPICDRGGECPLQDQALEYGPGESRFFEEKRHFTKAKPIGPVLMLDRERCITCARCTRFGEIVAGDNALEFIDRGYRTEVGVPDGKSLESKFIGNTIQICPVGALTSQVYRFRARPWDNEPTETTCTLCPVGCSMILDERDGEIVRTRCSENALVNDMWLCDKGWFGYEFTSSKDRLSTPLIRKNGKLEKASWEEAIDVIASHFKSEKIAAFGGNPLTVEENYLFQKLIREGGKSNHIDHRIGEPIFSLEEEGLPPGMDIFLNECANLSEVYLLGVDLTEEFPIIWLRLKEAINRGAKVTFLGHYAPEMANHLHAVDLHAPGEELAAIKRHAIQGTVFIGSQYLRSSNRGAILKELSHLPVNVLEGRGNSMGARFAGMRPDLGPLGEVLKEPGLNFYEVLRESADSGWDFLYVAGANPAKKVPSQLWKNARRNLKCLVVQDLFLNETAASADVVLPTLSYVEKSGSFINIEGRVSKIRPGKEIPENVLSDGEIFYMIARKLGINLELETFFRNRLKAEKISLERTPLVMTSVSTHNSGLYASFSKALFDRGVRMQHNEHLIQLAKEPRVRIHPQEGEKRGLKAGSVVELVANGNRIKATIAFDGKVAFKTIVLPLDLPVQEFGVNLMNGLEVHIYG